MATGPPLYFPSRPRFPLLWNGKRKWCPLAMDSCGSIQSSLQERRKSGHRVPLVQSQSAATSAPGLLAASGWAQMSGHVIEKGGACSRSASGPAQWWLGRGHTSCNKTDPPRCNLGLGFTANYWSPSNLGLLSDVVSMHHWNSFKHKKSQTKSQLHRNIVTHDKHRYTHAATHTHTRSHT